MLIDVDLGALSSLLNPNKLKLQSKGIASVASRVMNIKQLAPAASHDTVSEALVRSFCQHYGAVRCIVALACA